MLIQTWPHKTSGNCSEGWKGYKVGGQGVVGQGVQAFGVIRLIAFAHLSMVSHLLDLLSSWHPLVPVRNAMPHERMYALWMLSLGSF
jgi:hypothetical protein